MNGRHSTIDLLPQAQHAGDAVMCSGCGGSAHSIPVARGVTSAQLHGETTIAEDLGELATAASSRAKSAFGSFRAKISQPTTGGEPGAGMRSMGVIGGRGPERGAGGSYGTVEESGRRLSSLNDD
jgi:hypothetical protein